MMPEDNSQKKGNRRGGSKIGKNYIFPRSFTALAWMQSSSIKQLIDMNSSNPNDNSRFKQPKWRRAKASTNSKQQKQRIKGITIKAPHQELEYRQPPSLWAPPPDSRLLRFLGLMLASGNRRDWPPSFSFSWISSNWGLIFGQSLL